MACNNDSEDRTLKKRLDEIEEIGLLLKAAMRESERRLNELLRPLGITAGQAEVLQILERCGPMSLGELGELLVAEGGHPSRLIDRMVNAGLLLRETAADDRRRISIGITEHGQELAQASRESKKEFRRWVRAQLQGTDMEHALRFFRAYLSGTELEKTVLARESKGPLAGS
ncbi:MarR family winged helix-turn-helix transcriptional regulator [Terriglobus sp. RCC_193]|uniref:MarR family winged helix-turn-helix transcriptional regulator n=1 Tax=Terriglobus sp. RCC_193 TaxID=3239218 RepID=UPI0035244B0B